MKKDIKKSISINFKNAKLCVEDGRIIIYEMDKEGFVTEENDLLDAIDCLIDEEGINISFKKDNTLEE